MRRVFLSLLAVAGVVPCVVARAETDPARVPQVLRPGKVASRSGQFRISGGDAAMRGVLAMLADDAKDELHKLTGETDGWKIPVSVRMHGEPGDVPRERPVVISLVEFEGVPELRIDVHLARGVDSERFKRETSAILLYERALRGRRTRGQAEVPAWLVDGICEAVAWGQGRSDRRLYRALFRSGGLFRLADLFGQSENDCAAMDGATRAAFRVSSGAMVMSLLGQPDGKEAFRGFLDEVASHGGEMEPLLARHFPGLSLSENSLAKWWALQMANMGGLNVLGDLMGIEATERALEEALHLDFRDGEGLVVRKPLAEWSGLGHVPSADKVAAVRGAEEALVRLSYRSFPAYRELLRGYQSVLLSIATGRGGDIDNRLKDLADRRAALVGRSARGRDFLDWFEITRAREVSGEFDDYIRLKERLAEGPRPRKDRVSAYLDRMDGMFRRDDPRDRRESR